MREMLEPVFGESGAIVAQFFVILIFVLILIGVGYLIFSRYYGTALSRGGRSRPPRLGIVDSISVDHRRRLVLVRRDNVEHLLLIGSNADLVVESEIARAVPAGARPRQQTPRQQPPAQPEAQPQPQSRPQPMTQSPPQPQGSAQSRPQSPNPPQRGPSSPQPRASAPVAQSRTEPPAAPNQPKAPQTIAARPQAPGMSEPIPFPQHRRPPTRPHPPAAEPAYAAAPDGGRGPEQPNVPTRATTMRDAPAGAAPVAAASPGAVAVASASAHFEEPAHPTTVEPAFSRAKAPNDVAEQPIQDLESVEPTPAKAKVQSGIPAASAPPTAADAGDASPAASGEQSEPSTQNQAATDDAERAAAVSNLEEEMARLLGQITSKGDS